MQNKLTNKDKRIEELNREIQELEVKDNNNDWPNLAEIRRVTMGRMSDDVKGDMANLIKAYIIASKDPRKLSEKIRSKYPGVWQVFVAKKDSMDHYKEYVSASLEFFSDEWQILIWKTKNI